MPRRSAASTIARRASVALAVGLALGASSASHAVPRRLGPSAPPAPAPGAKPEAVAAPAPAPAKKPDKDLTFWAGFRYIAQFSTTDPIDTNVGGTLLFDIFRVGGYGTYRGITTNFQFRFYNYMAVATDAWAGLKLGKDDAHELRLGLQSVPIGIHPYACHTYWLGPGWLSGFEDDHDIGLSLSGALGNLAYVLAFFKESDRPGDDLARYSPDVVHDGVQNNSERNTLNGFASYKLGPLELGASGMLGQLYNADTEKNGWRWAATAHAQLAQDRWRLVAQGLRYVFHPEDPPGTPSDSIAIGAHLTTFPLARSGAILTGAAEYNLPINGRAIDMIKFYADTVVMLRLVGDGGTSEWYAVGANIASTDWPLWTHIEGYATKNVPFIGGSPDDALGSGNYSRNSFEYSLVVVLEYSVPVN